MRRRSVVLLFILLFMTASGCSKTGGMRGEGAGDRTNPDTPKIKLVIGGSGANLALAKKLAGKYMDRNPGVEIVIPSSLGSGGGIEKTADGILNIGLVSRPFNPEEEQYQLARIPYARVAVVMAVHPGVKISGLTSGQVVAIYSGKIRNWREVGGDDQPIKLLTREYNDSSRMIFNQHIKGFAALKESPGAVFLRTDQAMNEAIQSVPNSIGWTDLGAIRAERLSVKPVAIDGLLPTETMVRNGRYPFVKELAFVVKGKPEGETGNFIDFVRSWEGKKVMVENGYLPVE